MTKKNISRRDFLKGGAAGAAAVMATSLMGASIFAEEAATEGAESASTGSWDTEYDVVVAGAGGTGVCAAAAAAEAGATVMMIEKSGVVGGTTTYSGGVMQAAGTEYQKEFSDFQDDTPDKHAAEWLAEGEGMLDENLVKDLANGAPECITWLAEKCGIKWNSVYGHCHVPYVDDELMADRIHVYEGGGASGQGGVYVQGVFEYATSLGAELMLTTEVTDLITENGRVVGVEATDKDGNVKRIKANKGVVLATAGIDHNVELSRQYNPQQYWINTKYPELCLCAATDTGDGIRMGLELGAAFVGGGTIDFCGKTGAATSNKLPVFPEFIVNNAGVRFVCEDATYAYHYRAIFQQEMATGAPTYMIFGANGGSLPEDVPNTSGSTYAWQGDALQAAVESGELVTADTIEELAEKIGVNAINLKRTMDAWNEDTAAGNPDAFGRIEGLEPIEAPFYAYRNMPYNLGALGGLKIDRQCRVLTNEDSVIPGLFAAGLNAGGWVGPYYPGSGTAIMGTCYLGRTAGKAAAEEA